jgi:hypothetical protein
LTAVSADVEQQLAWEARQRPRAGGAAIAAAILSVGSLIWMQEALKDLPRAGFLSSLAQAFKPGPVGDQPSLLAPVFQYYVDHGATFIAISVLQAVGYLLMAWLLTFLGAAARARRPEMPKLGIYVALVGAVLLAAAVLLGEIGRSTAFPAFLDSKRTIDDATDISGNVFVAASQLLQLLVPLVLGAGILLISLNAMRVGILTRFHGILGIAAGALSVFQQYFVFAPFILGFWLLSVGFMLIGFPRDNAPPAWRSGQAEPWPSQREAAERRRAAGGRGQRAGKPAAAEESAPASPGTRPHPSSKKRKRKRRA